ncbi:MAG: flagellar basal body rod protein FlgC [Pseudomonadota bacterium]|jgi:flagellar basal-body rod protein FlgC|uniref:Flagellar basal-body rod protein FlgC n=1 Tax=hydrothermal vent metagenome TaxID=652676 RepID=A0A170PNH2_9ZZZZ|nr:flagellar basal body rod protein FlgC [Sphingomonas sp.]WEJ98870.1 MAG: flagellar basal body rod protein FlgC [Sphingomonas sp.]
MADNGLNIFQVAGRAMSAQLVRMNTTASNLANAGAISGSADTAYRTIKPVFRTEYDKATGLATVNVEQIVTAGGDPTKLYDPSHPMADKDGNVFVSAVDETRELVDMMETARSYQNNVEVMQTAKSLILDTLKLGR